MPIPMTVNGAESLRVELAQRTTSTSSSDTVSP